MRPLTILPVMVLLMVAGIYTNFHTPSPVPLRTDLNLFPLQIDEWRGINAPLPDDTIADLGADSELSRIYRRGEGFPIHLYIGYFERQEQGRELIDYRTAMLHTNTSEILIPTKSGVIRINRLVERDKKVYFWYNLNGRIVTNRYMAKAYAIMNALLKGRTNGAIVIISIPGNDDSTSREAEEFLKGLYPILYSYIPRS